MNKRKIDLKQHQMKPASRAYLVKIVVYVVILTVLGLLISRLMGNKAEKDPKEVTTIDAVSLDVSDSLN